MKRIFVKEITTEEYMRDYKDAAYFIELCKQCGNYGKSWACPPFEFDADTRLEQWCNALIVACRFELPGGDHSVSEAMPLLRENRIELEERLLALEKEYGGLAFGFSGECLHCRHCARGKGVRCIHPDKVRPAIEAYGFNVSKTMDKLFGISIEWAKDGVLPHTLTLVGALFHNEPMGSIKF